jgi:hypothetical protein
MGGVDDGVLGSGLMPFDWLMLFGGTVLGGVIVLLF